MFSNDQSTLLYHNTYNRLLKEGITTPELKIVKQRHKVQDFAIE